MSTRSPLHTRSARRDVHSFVCRRSCLWTSPLGLAPSPTVFSMVRPTRHATKFTHLFEENLVVGLLLHLPLGPFLRAQVKSRVGVVVRQSPSSSTPASTRALGILRDFPSRGAFASIPRLHRSNERAYTNSSSSFVHASSSHRPRVVDRAPSVPKTSARVVVRVTDGRLASTSASRSCAPWPSSYRRPKPWRPWRPSIRALSEASFVRVRRARQRGGIDRARATSRARASARASTRSIGGARGARFYFLFCSQYECARAPWFLCN